MGDADLVDAAHLRLRQCRGPERRLAEMAGRKARAFDPTGHSGDGDIHRPPPGRIFVGPDTVRQAIGDGAVCTINALSPELHRGDSVRYGQPGRILGSVNVPAASLLDPVDNTFAKAEEVAAHFANAGATSDKKTIPYCGGGIAATLDAFLLHQLGYTDIAVYDGSMSQWATDKSVPIETG
jgi:thiosulfate/3-mercaptopyruvate sulfurtransferase